jgi:hypothetical protein
MAGAVIEIEQTSVPNGGSVRLVQVEGGDAV